MNKRNTIEALILIDQQAATIEIGKQTGYSLGRDPTNSLVLNDIKASRQHAVIRWEGGHFVVRDMGSRNGTFINDERIQVAQLEDGDILRIGNTAFMVRMATQEMVERELFNQRRQMACLETHMDLEDEFRVNEGGFSGSLRTLSMVEIIQTIMQFGKDGRLVISNHYENDVAEAYFREGEIVHAEYGQESGLTAMYEMMKLEQGVFEFQNDVQSPGETITQSTMSILMESCRRKDESKR
ncbi:FHA domain-containing protein [bacterium]|nr:FHA domain-containing protein [candidate division CSSED10-310 bacterium]